jgi:hypothetical protein
MRFARLFHRCENNDQHGAPMEVTNVQLYLAIGIPILFNVALVGFLFAHMNSRFDAVDRGFDDMRELWRAELRRVEGVLDARLSHLEER